MYAAVVSTLIGLLVAANSAHNKSIEVARFARRTSAPLRFAPAAHGRRYVANPTPNPSPQVVSLQGLARIFPLNAQGDVPCSTDTMNNALRR
jgi:hypothetical protein